jgi:hypothetical protein
METRLHEVVGTCANCQHDDGWYLDEYDDIKCSCDPWLRQGFMTDDGTICDWR